MNKTVIGIISFAAGAAIGSVATFMSIKNKYEQIAKEEIEEVREVYMNAIRKTEEVDDEHEDSAPVNEAPKVAELKSYNDVVKESGYINYGNITEAEVEEMVKEKTKEIVEECNDILKKTEDKVNNKPYVISPDEFGDEYNVVTLVCYNDKVVTTYDTGEVLTDEEVEKLVGLDSLSRFGEYEEDSVFVRNDSIKVDYEILRDEENYSD